MHTPPDIPYDLFVSYHSTDKEQVVEPLVKLLSKHGISTWFKEQEIKLGDSITDKLNHGLANSRYGLVILSPEFVQEGGLKAELNSFLSKENKSAQKAILPILHNISHEDLMKDYPLLQDRLMCSTQEGMEKVVERILDAIQDGNKVPQTSQIERDKTKKRKFLPMLISVSLISLIAIFLSFYPRLPSFQKKVKQDSGAQPTEEVDQPAPSPAMNNVEQSTAAGSHKYQSQSYHLKGYIFDEENDEGIGGAKVYVEGKKDTAYTNVEGKFQFPVLKSVSKYEQIWLVKEGFDSIYLNINLSQQDSISEPMKRRNW